MKTVILTVIFTTAICGCATADVSPSRMPAQEAPAKVSSIGRLVEYKDGLLKIDMDTCGGRISPVVQFKALEEVFVESAKIGVYKATIAKSAELASNTKCPFVVPTRFELDLKKLWKDWSDSAEGTPDSRKIIAAGGEIQISVSAFLMGINLNWR